MPRIHLRYERSTDRGTHQLRQSQILWRSLNSDGEEAANRDEGGQHVQGERGYDAEASCTYCGRALDYSDGQSGDSHVLVPISCTNGGFVHSRCMLDRADRIARGHADPRPCVAFQSEWPGGIRPPHPAELATGVPMTELGGKWAAVGRALQFTAFLQRDALGTEPASYVTTGVHNTFELMAAALRRALRLCCAPFSVMRWTYPKRPASISPVQGN